MRSGLVRIDRVYGNEAAAAGGSATAAGPGASLTFLRRLETAMSEGEWAQHSVCSFFILFFKVRRFLECDGDATRGTEPCQLHPGNVAGELN